MRNAFRCSNCHSWWLDGDLEAFFAKDGLVRMSRRCVHAVAQANRLTMYFRRIKIDLCNLNEAAEVMHMMKNDVRVVWVLFAK
ncbi:hypothetical protein T05_9166 [Trichinella murrelli]|uniref:Uncharacterized protein n=1 Tax=Trichinella murrelli TaxID=144512 RepID=A0A0V0UEN0_9BILA|nr:hypothetical protein T05_9166 [Trichinella murrelli]